MDGQKVLKYALNLADLMRKASVLLGEASQQTETFLAPAAVPQRSDEDHTDHENLYAIGLDDTGIMAIIIELSQDRSNFKIWTPYDEAFLEALKRSVPKGAREFDWDERCWRVDIEWFGNAQHLLLEHFPHVDRRYTDRAVRMLEAIAEQDREEEEQARREQEARSQRVHDRRAEHAYHQYQRTARKARERADRDYERARKRTHSSYTGDPDQWEETNGEDPYKILGVQHDAPDEVIKAAHKAQARKHHTDHGGDRDTMARINAAFEAIGRARGWKA
jgi:hypothetical protein